MQALVVGWRQPHHSRPGHGLPHHNLRVREEDGILEGLKALLVQLELESEGLIRHTPAALEHGNRLVEDLLKRHC